MSKLKYLLVLLTTSCSLPYLTNTNIKEKQKSDLQIKNGYSATGEFMYYEPNPPIKGKINLITDSNENLWISINSLFNLELFRVILKKDTLYLINKIEKKYQRISLNDSLKNTKENLLKKVKGFENTEFEYGGINYRLFFSEFNDQLLSNIPEKIIVKKGGEKEVLEISIKRVQRTDQKVKINIPDSYEKN